MSTIAFAALAASACRSLPSLAPKRLSSRAKRARYAAPVLVVLASWSLPDSCYTADRPEPAPPEIKQVDIIPQTVFVTPGKQFTLQVRLLDQDNGVLPETGEPAVTWSWAPLPGLKQVSANAQSVVLEAGDVASGNTLSVSLNASVGTSHGSGTVVVVGNPAPGNPDEVRMEYRAAAVPDVALVDGKTSSGCAHDSLVAFVAVGLVGDFSGDCPPERPGRIATFSADYAMAFPAVSWNASQNIETFSSGTGPGVPLTGSLPVSLTVWVAALGEDVAAVAQQDIGYASGVFGHERTGLVFAPAMNSANASGSIAGTDCLSFRQQLEGLGVPGAALGPNVLTVVYVDDIVAPPANPGELPTSSGYRGYTCPFESQIGTIVLISWLSRSATTLAHELGHALGLVRPVVSAGHTVDLVGFSYTNLMWSGETDARTAARSHFTLGQAYRMNVDSLSWLYAPSPALRPWHARACEDSPDAVKRCPQLARDIVSLPSP